MQTFPEEVRDKEKTNESPFHCDWFMFGLALREVFSTLDADWTFACPEIASLVDKVNWPSISKESRHFSNGVITYEKKY